MKDLKLVIFDMDGLMFDTECVYCRATLEAACSLHLDVDMQVLYRAIGSSYFDIEKFFVNGIPNTVDVDRVLSDSVERAVEDMCANGVPKKPGLDELLEFLWRRGFHMAVATSTPLKRAHRLLEKAGVLSKLAFIITSEEVSKGKPYPDIFLAACERARILPRHALVLEDSINGGMAAKAAGIPYIIVPDINSPTEAVAGEALAVVNSLLDVISLI
jgi:HAD superfamily hydrolase (TIGR01509 family)